MKKLYILAIAIVFGLSINAQTVLLEEGFENEAGASWPTGWTTWSASDLIGTDLTATDFTTDFDPTWFVGNSASFGGDNPEYIHTGDYAAMLGYDAGATGNAFHYLMSPELELTEDMTLTYWHWYFNNPVNSWYSNTYCLVFDGTNYTTVESFIGEDNPTNNEYATPIIVDLTAFTGETVQIVYVFEYNNGYQYMVDDVVIASPAETYNVTFNVDMTGAIDSGLFTAGDVLYITGSFLDWTEPGLDPTNQTLTDDDGDNIYTLTRVDSIGDYAYKYFIGDGWGGGEWNGDPNRTYSVVDMDVVTEDVFGEVPAAINTISAEFKIGPNPTNGLVTIIADANYNVDVLDITGKIIATSTMQNNATQIDLKNQSAGLYIIRLSNDEGSVQYKIIKQ
ncbi:MAG: T9SS type A sorting domain-containing protein [Bacteroidales bacterium]|nr:T9SS type A sorting domain-containing protein [Bacteroidales bacterium]